MRKTSVKILSVFLCGLLIYNSLGYLVVFSVMRMAIRHQMWSQLSTLSDDKMTTFSFNKNNPESRLKIINRHEIRVDGKLYDIVRKSENGNHIKFVCINDEKEEQLIAKLKIVDSRDQSSPLRTVTSEIVEKIIKSGYSVEDSGQKEIGCMITSKNFREIHYKVPDMSLFLPPPKS